MTALRTAVLDIARSHENPGPLRVLEIGAGGAVSASLTQTLATEELVGAAVEFLCAESSEPLLRAARAGIAKRARVRFKVLDLELDPTEQGFTPGSFDVIICANMLAGATDPVAAARRLTGMLAPGGWLLMTEPTREHYEFLISGGFLPRPATDARTAPDAVPPSCGRWLDALAGAGAGPVMSLPDDGHPLAALGYRLFATRRP